MGLLSKAARRLARSRLGHMSRVSSVPFHEPAPTLLARPALNRVPMGGPMGAVESNVDPRLILGGGAAASFPIGALAGLGVTKYDPYGGRYAEWEREMARQEEEQRNMRMRNQELRDMLEFMKDGY